MLYTKPVVQSSENPLSVVARKATEARMAAGGGPPHAFRETGAGAFTVAITAHATRASSAAIRNAAE